MNLPDMPGVEVMRRIIKATSAIVIVITGDEARYSYDSMAREGAADFIVKPVRISELATRVKQAREVRALTETKERLIAELERLATRDELTGLYNYRHFHDQLKAEVLRTLRYQRPLCLMVVDVDHFKAVNDALGHAEGDRVLTGIARIMDAKSRAADSVFRYGGEEFAIILPETLCDQALAMAERVRQAVEQAELAPAQRVTVSVGVAEFRATEDADVLFRRADTALYAAKRAGRNRVAQA